MIAKKILFIVQGEGRGHMTQALALNELIETTSHQLVAVMVGKSKMRVIPDFFKKAFVVPVIEFESPNFLQDKDARRIKVFESLLFNLFKARTFFRSIGQINKAVKQYRPDVVVNFYEPLAGLYNYYYRPKIKMVCIAHQYIYLHPEFIFPNGVSKSNVMAIKLLTRITALRSSKKIALSFYKTQNLNYKSIIVSAPLLRSIVLKQPVTTGSFILVYLLNSGLKHQIIEWHKQNPHISLQCFADHEQPADEWIYDDTLCFHRLNDKKFIQLMAEARGVVTTAGFETICEAMYMGKPVLMVPVQNHFEQYCNARDAYKAGAGVFSDTFKIDILLSYISKYQSNKDIAVWIKENNSSILDEIV